jgi:FlaA1/EpsC-like NDP-sugar epimerase
MTRFILTLKQSVELVLKAMEEGVGGEVFVRKMPAHTIKDLVDVMLESVTKKPKIEIIGVRPGEKIHEVLVSAAEATRTIEDGENYIILPQIQIAAVEKKYKSVKRLLPDFKYSSKTAYQTSKSELRRVLRKEGWI